MHSRATGFRHRIGDEDEEEGGEPHQGIGGGSIGDEEAMRLQDELQSLPMRLQDQWSRMHPIVWLQMYRLRQS
jgi:hypothetical protein